MCVAVAVAVAVAVVVVVVVFIIIIIEKTIIKSPSSIMFSATVPDATDIKRLLKF